ncbi:MAG: threonine--tRNA ligase [Candidatus Omnitrophota bacterium]|jgi:threonyl-tRNA synthetase|nr:MAG: threonine--tRNA ligase [Candidatus Omnitrophota bacterium]
MSLEASSQTITLKVSAKDNPVEFPSGVTPLNVLQSHSGLPNDAVAARLNGSILSLTQPITEDGELQFLTFNDPEGKEVVFHSTAHLMAQAVTELFPGVKLAIGPPIAEGFYYDFEVERPFTPEDLQQIEERMEKRANDKLPVERFVMSREEALDYYKKANQNYKVELIEDFEDSSFSFYRQGDFVDMCRGPHVPHTGYLKHFKLLNCAGAYWRGDENRAMLQRIYGVAAGNRKELKDYLQKLEEAKERDHRKLGRELDLYSIHDEAGPGLIFWHPHGARIRNIIETFWRDEHYRRGYELVYIPHILRENLFIKSGHLENFRENMYSPMQVDNIDYYAKPMNCPGHILIFQSHLRSYRDLPIRYGELGTVYRYERSGVLHGLLRVRGFTQDDAHIFCRPDQLEEEITGVIDLADFMMNAFGFDYRLCLSTRPAKSIGSDEVWEHATETLRRALEKNGKPYDTEEGGGAFYGPKIDVLLLDALGRTWQGPTFQLDFNFPERFNIDYIDSDGSKKRCVMIHRTVLGSMERFLGNLIEHYKGAFPAWLSPVQIKVLPITDDQHDYARKLHQRLKSENLRSELDDRNEKIGYKIREAESLKIPFMFVVGKKEAEETTVAVRERGRKDHGVMSLVEALHFVRKATEIPRSSLQMD